MMRVKLRHLRIQIGNPGLMRELTEHFACSGFAVETNGSTAIRVALVDAPDEEQARREIQAQLLVWGVFHPEDPGHIRD